MRKNIVVISILLALCVVVSSYILYISENGGGEEDGFFYWSDGYVAMPDQSEQTIAFTYFYEQYPFDSTEVSSVSFVNSNCVNVMSFEIDNMQKGRKYNSLALMLHINSEKMGVDSFSEIQLGFMDGSVKKYSIGNWVFEVGEADSGVLNTWESPAVSSNSSAFGYSYQLSAGAIKSIQYGAEQIIEAKEEEGLDAEGKIMLEHSDAPLKFIQTKVLVEQDGQTKIAYGHGCYCGGMGTEEDSIKISKDRMLEQGLN